MLKRRYNEVGSAVTPYTARVTLPERRQRVQTWIWRGEPSTSALTRLTLGFHIRFERRWECETAMPNVTPLSQT